MKSSYELKYKRLFDIILSLSALIIFAPVMLVVAVLVRKKLGKPVIFAQLRPGLNEKIFKMYKFRTMTDERDANGTLLSDEKRLTPFGKFLRSTSLDELPELFLDSFAQHALDQYFDPLLISFGSDEVIADCGGFIGDTANSYFRMKNRAKLYYLIEPSEKNINIAKRSLKEFDNIHFCNCATGLRNDDDTLIKEPLTFIKMDIEGAEIESLKGAREQIKNNKPKLAICAYHKPDDAWQIVKTLTELRPDYKFYFRLYFSPYCEAVMYAL